MSFLHLFIVNKSGGLIHHRPLLSSSSTSSKHTNTTPTINKIGTNEWLRIASTFHSLYAIAAEASPIRLPNNRNNGTFLGLSICPIFFKIVLFIALPLHLLILSIVFAISPSYPSIAGADDGIEEIRVSGMMLRCLQTITGIKFVITIAVSDQSVSTNDTLLSSILVDVLKEIYVLYTECVLKDPFYELEMPIRSDLFIQGVDIVIQKYTLVLQKVSSNSNAQYPNSAISNQSKQLY
jgi:trafficking protein particle complex subunit 4